MTRRKLAAMAMAVGLAVGWSGMAGAAERIDQREFEMMAFMELEPGVLERGDTVQNLIACLKYWNAGDRSSYNEVVVKRTGGNSFTVQTKLRSPAIFHFESMHEKGVLVARLLRVEYLVNKRGYQQLTDTEAKRTVLNAVCGRS